MRVLTSYLIGLIFGVGISISGMANPAKVLNFFDVAGTWDPSLAFVMGGALVVTFIGYRYILKRSAPFLSARFQLPTRSGSALDWWVCGFWCRLGHRRFLSRWCAARFGHRSNRRSCLCRCTARRDHRSQTAAGETHQPGASPSLINWRKTHDLPCRYVRQT